MTSEEKATNEHGRETCCGFPFGNRQEMWEMMRTWCSSQKGVFACCPMTQMMKDKRRPDASGEQAG